MGYGDHNDIKNYKVDAAEEWEEKQKQAEYNDALAKAGYADQGRRR